MLFEQYLVAYGEFPGAPGIPTVPVSHDVEATEELEQLEDIATSLEDPEVTVKLGEHGWLFPAVGGAAAALGLLALGRAAGGRRRTSEEAATRRAERMARRGGRERRMQRPTKPVEQLMAPGEALESTPDEVFGSIGSRVAHEMFGRTPRRRR